MKITDILNSGKRTLSFEVFPPKKEVNLDKFKHTIFSIGDLNPDFMSVTYGAGGGVSQFTADIVNGLQQQGTDCIAHLTCVSSTKEHVQNMLQLYKENGIENILALRGDYPEGFDKSTMVYEHASDLIPEIKEAGDFCVGGACYPIKHPDSRTSREDIEFLKLKIDAGCEFLTTQMFFDNNVYYNYLWRLKNAGIDVPVIAGIMPITTPQQIGRVVDISSSPLPQGFIRILEEFGDNPEQIKQAGISYATQQIVDLYANGVQAVHVYSMNKPEVAAEIQSRVSALVG